MIIHKGAMIRAFQDLVVELQATNAQLQQQQPQAQVLTAAPPVSMPPVPAPRSLTPQMALLEKFDGSADCCRGFIHQCAKFFAHQPELYSDDATKCTFMLSLFTGRALDWASVVWYTDPQVKTSEDYFAGQIRKVFEYPARGKDISVQLMELRQGSDSAADYAIKFRTLAAQFG